MDSSTIITLIYAGMALVVAIIYATIMRVKQDRWVKFDFVDTFLCMLFGVLWPLTIVSVLVYVASDFLYRKFFKAKKK